jgi:excisionase family DNA binding protein
MVTPAFPVFLSETEAAQYLSLSVKTLRRWRFDRKGPTYAKLNNKLIRYSRSDLDDWMQQQRVIHEEGL